MTNAQGENAGNHFYDHPIRTVTEGSFKIVGSLLSMFFEKPSVYKFNEESGRYEEHDPRAETKYDLPPRIF